jgi:hypothetical protein
MLSPDGTVLHCLPGYWDPRDLVFEMRLAWQLNQVWTDPSLSRSQKDQLFRQMHLAHEQQHPVDMVYRSKMQGFDQKYEAQHRLLTSDTIRDPQLIMASSGSAGMLPPAAFKTTDEIVHERMARRPFVPFQEFDVARYVDYGRPLYDKHEDQRNLNGQRVAFDREGNKLIGNTDSMPHKRRAGRGGLGRYAMQRGLQYFIRHGVASSFR